MKHLQILTLSSNRLNNLTNQMFTGLTSLRKLDVSGNNISFIDSQTFDDLKSLRILDISANLLQINDPLLLPPRAFLKINQLEEIYIQGNCKKQTTSCQFPTLVISQLKGLKKLGVDVHHEDGFRPGDTDLLHLQTLVIDLKSFCKIEFIKWNFFDKTPNLISLSIQNCPLLRLHPKAYAKLLHLENLTLNSLPPYYDLKLALDDLQGLQNSSLKYLSLSGLNVYNCVERNLDAKNGQYLRYLNLIELDISYNNIITILPGFVDMLPKTLKKLDLSGNDLSAGLMYRPLIFSEELTELNLSYQSYQFISRCPEMYRKSDGNTTTENEDFLNNENNEPDNSLPKRTCTSNESTLTDIADGRSRVLQDEQRLKTNSSTFYFPNYLKVWNGIQFPEFGIQILNPDFENNSSLIEINFSGSFINFWGSSHLLTSIKKADLSNNFCENISMNFIPENSSLEHLSISNNFLGLFFRTDTEGLTLSKAKQLKYLDVSRNAINGLSLFSRLDHLQTLIASENRLQIINCSFSRMKDLRIIDFSQNSITWISRQSRDDLDLIATDHEVYLDLTSNPLLCSCEGIELMRWLATTKVFLLNRDFLLCKNETNELQEIGDLAERVEHLNIKCTSKITTVLISVFSSITFCLVLAMALTYRYRWKLRYLRSIALAKLLNWNTLDARDTFRFDTYILYTDETRRFVLNDCVRELEKNRGKTICLEEFNFLPDTSLIQNIVSAVQNSFKTVVIVTPEFYQDEFSEYRVKMALMEEIYAHRSTLYLCMYEPTGVTDLSKDFLDVTNRGDVIEFPPREGATEEIDQKFWDDFSQVISQD
ncbi:unnamed protein product [Lymnaea stagnalis]|uniref:TIR domain-containing protein n=1 Tax=Lymnaea stagnalis TaxID=6523 RepID=A0AAV2IB54_LYMST